MNSGYGQNIYDQVNTNGGIQEYTFSIGGNVNNKIFFGVTFGCQDFNYSEQILHNEYNIPGNQLNSFIYNSSYQMLGEGYNVKLGTIIVPVEFLRIGIAYHSPTYFDLRSNYKTSMFTYFTNDPTGTNYNSFWLNSGTYSNYSWVNTPQKWVLSAAFRLKQFALIDVDYELVNYSKIGFGSNDLTSSYVNSVSSAIQQYFKSTDNLRIGAEIKITPTIAIRGGYAYYGTPINSGNAINYPTESSTTSISGGIGYRNRFFYLDLAYVSTEMKISSNPLYAGNQIVNTDNVTDKLLMTIGLKF